MKRACWGTECRKAQLNEMTVSLQTAHPAKPWVSMTGAGGTGGVGEGGTGERGTEQQGRGQARKANWSSHLENAQRKAQVGTAPVSS